MRSLLGRFHRPMSRGLVNNMLTMNNLGDGSTLSLDFTAMGGVLDPRLTFSRASTATFVNSSGYVEWAGANLILNSTMLVGTSFTPVTSGGGTVTINNDNTVTFASTAGRATWLQSIASLQVGLSVTFSIEVTALTNTNIRVSDLFQAGTGFSSQVYNYTDSSGNTTAGIGAFTTLPGIGLYTVNAVITATPGNVIFGTDCNGVARTGSVTITRPQFQYGTRVSSRVYFANSSTAAAYHAPRFDYSPTNIGEPRGLLIEGQTINVCPQSQALTTGWQNVAMNTPTVPSSPTITDPFGGTSATWKLVASSSGTSVPHTWRTATLTFTAASYTFSFWAKAAEYDRIMLCDPGSGQGGCLFVLTGNGTATVVANVVTPTNPQITPYPNGWYRCSVTMVTAAANYAFGISGYPSSGATTGAFGPNYISDGTSGVYATAMQIELGSGASSYIFTGASQVTRNADQVVLSNLAEISFNQLAGTMYSQVELVERLRGSFIPYGSFDTTGGGRGWWWLRHNHDTSVGQRILGSAYNSVGGNAINSSNYTHSSGVFKFATSLDPTAGRMVYAISGGSAQITTATGFTLATAAQMSINKNNDVLVTETGSMWFRTLKYWPTALPDAQLTSITS